MSPRCRLYTSVGRSSRRNLSGYSRFPNPSTSLVARIWTFSSMLISFFDIGAQAACAYSRWGRTWAVYSFLNDFPLRYENDRLIRPTIAFAVRTFVEMCSENDSSESTINPKSFSSNTWSSSVSFRVLNVLKFAEGQNMALVRVKIEEPFP